MSDGPEKSARDATAFRDPATSGGWLSPVRECLLQRIPALNHYRAGIELRLVSVVDHRWRADRGRCGLVLRVCRITLRTTPPRLRQLYHARLASKGDRFGRSAA